MKLKRYLIILAFINIVAVVLFFIMNSYFNNRIYKMSEEIDNLESKQYIAFDINEELYKINRLFLKLAVFQSNKIIVDRINRDIHKNISFIRKELNILKSGGVYTKIIYLNMENSDFLKKEYIFKKPKISLENIDLIPKIKYLEDKLVKIDTLIDENNNIELVRELKLLPSLFDRMQEDVNRIFYTTNMEINNKRSLLESKRSLYHRILLGFIFLISIFVAVIFYLIIKSILDLYNESEYRLYHDNLTNLYNRNSLEKELLSKNKTRTLFLIDIERFRNYNELYGNRVGNQILLKVAEYLKIISSECEFKNSLYRVSGDVFAILSEEKLDLVLECASRIREKIMFENFVILDSLSIDLDVKIGVSEGDYELLEKSTASLNEAKVLNKHIIFKKVHFSEKKSSIEKAIFWQKRIRKAIKEDRIVPFFQPILNKEWKIIKYESLMRLKLYEDGEVKYIPPFFLDIAIKNGQYLALSKEVVGKIFETFKNSGEFSFNLNYLDIKDEDSRLFIFSLFNKYEGIGKRTTLEILEDETIENYSILYDFIKKLRNYGVQIAIDDFGSGYSNYKRILDLKPDFIKIDGTLIKDIDKDIQSRAIVESIIPYAHQFGIKIVAEYVHSKEVFDVCVELGVDYFQGYYFSPPKIDL